MLNDSNPQKILPLFFIAIISTIPVASVFADSMEFRQDISGKNYSDSQEWKS